MNTKVTNKFTLMFLSVMFMLLLAGCALFQKDISGVYTTDILIRDIYDEELIQEYEESGMGFFLDIPVAFVFELNKDNTFSFHANVDSFKQSVYNALDDNIDVFLESALNEHGIMQDRYEDYAKYAGYEDYEDMKASYLEKMKQTLEDDTEMWEGVSKTAEGTYEVKKDQVMFTTVDDGIGFEQATINEDGSLSLETSLDESDNKITMVFKP